MSSNRQSPNNREVISARDSITGLQVYPTATNNKLDVNATVTSSVPTTSNTPTIAQVASSGTNVTILASNALRKQAMFFNDSTQALYLKLGTTATSSSYTVKMAAASYYELPQPIYTGEIDGIWVSANGNVLVTEET